MDKRSLLNNIIARLEAEVVSLARAARAAHAEATHESSKAENKYDTRGLEASYLARGQSRQAAETVQAIEEFKALDLRAFAPGDAAQVGALVVVASGKERTHYFIGPRAGGTEVEEAGREVLVITPQSPLGRQLLGRRAGDRLKLEPGGAAGDLKLLSVE